MWIEYQRFNWKEYVSLRRYYNLQCKCKALEQENKKLKGIICLYEKDEEEYKNNIEELEDEIRRIYNEAHYLWFKF